MTTTEIEAEVAEVVAQLCEADPTSPDAGFSPELWTRLAEGGFTLLGVPEELGGSGGDLATAAAAVRAAARWRAPVPLADTALVAGGLLAATGLPVPDDRPLAATTDELTADPGGTTVSGTVELPWGRYCGHGVIPVRRAGELLLTVLPLTPDGAGPTLVPDTNLAGEPRDTLVFDRIPLPAATVPAPPTSTVGAVLWRGALARTVQLAGAAETVLAMTLEHAAQREQFGKPLRAFQAVQQQLAALAAAVETMTTAASAVVDAATAWDGEPSPDALLAVAAAKASASRTARTVSALGHQIHGAIGFAREHALGTATTRLWSWRDEFGADPWWEDVLADLVLAGDGWWKTVTTDS